LAARRSGYRSRLASGKGDGGFGHVRKKQPWPDEAAAQGFSHRQSTIDAIVMASTIPSHDARFLSVIDIARCEGHSAGLHVNNRDEHGDE
jgi:hypothetical protein